MIHFLARRRLMELAFSLPLVALAGVAKAERACVDMSSLSDADRSLRTSLNFQLVSDNPNKICGGCSFFTADQTGCGQCSILSGPTTEKSRCDSWAAK